MYTENDYYGTWTVKLAKPGTWENGSLPRRRPLFDTGEAATIAADTKGATSVERNQPEKGGQPILRSLQWTYDGSSGVFESKSVPRHMLRMTRGVASQDDVDKGLASAVGNKMLTFEWDPHFASETHKGTYHAEG